MDLFRFKMETFDTDALRCLGIITGHWVLSLVHMREREVLNLSACMQVCVHASALELIVYLVYSTELHKIRLKLRFYLV